MLHALIPWAPLAPASGGSREYSADSAESPRGPQAGSGLGPALALALAYVCFGVYGGSPSSSKSVVI